MNADQTYNSIVFKKTADDFTNGSERQSVARAINTPDILSIKSQDYTDSKTKVPGRRHTFRLDRHDLDANLAKIDSSISCTLAVPSTVTTAQYDVIVATFKAIVADATFITNVLNNEK
jgi:hypothetical protein